MEFLPIITGQKSYSPRYMLFYLGRYVVSERSRIEGYKDAGCSTASIIYVNGVVFCEIFDLVPGVVTRRHYLLDNHLESSNIEVISTAARSMN